MKQETKTPESPFTGGEWKVYKHEAGRYYGDLSSDLGIGENGFMSTRTIAIILKNCGEEEAEANALLISEAKNLYKSLTELLEQFEKVVQPKYTLDDMLIIEAKAILSRINKQP